MSTNAKIIMWVVIAVVVIGGIWWWMSVSPTATAPTNTPPVAVVPTSSVPTPTAPTSTPAPSNGISATDDSNAALQADLSSTDAQMNGFSSDNTNINHGLSDQPVQQSSF